MALGRRDDGENGIACLSILDGQRAGKGSLIRGSTHLVIRTRASEDLATSQRPMLVVECKSRGYRNDLVQIDWEGTKNEVRC